jgi:DNA modification methylase
VTETVLLDGRVVIRQGDVRYLLREMPAESVHCVVTSPPYWGLRDYGTAAWVGGDPSCDHRSPTMRDGRNEQRATLAGSVATNRDQLLLAARSECGKCGAIRVDQQLGLEPTLGEHLETMVAVFREIKRVLRKDGIVWLNYGDCYATSPNGRLAADTKATGNDDRTFRDKPFSTVGPIQARSNAGEGQHFDRRGGVLKSKDLCLVPQMLALALRDDGWWLRSQIPWIKRNAMPESITDRPATAIEYVFLLTKSQRYFYDAEAVKRAASPNTNARLAQDVASQAGSLRAHGGTKTNGAMKAVIGRPKLAPVDSGIRANGSFEAGISVEVLHSRNFRNTDLFFDSLDEPWGLISDVDGSPLALDVPSASFSDAHFATFPVALVDPLIRAASSEKGVCAICGAPWIRVTGNAIPTGGRGAGNGFRRSERISVGGRGDETPWVPKSRDTLAWEPGCRCSDATSVPATVLDPFGGSGTVGVVAARLGRNAILLELNPSYVEMARHRISEDWMGEDERVRSRAKRRGAEAPGPLFADEQA